MGRIVGAVFGGDSLWAVIAGGVSFLLAALLTFRVQEATAYAAVASRVTGAGAHRP